MKDQSTSSSNELNKSHDERNFIGSTMQSFRSRFESANNSNISSTIVSYVEGAKNRVVQYANVGAQYIYSLFTTHPNSKQMTYSQHFMTSFVYFLYSFGATISFLFHSIFPFTFETKGSDLTCALFNKLCDDGILEVDSDSDNESEQEEQVEEQVEEQQVEEQQVEEQQVEKVEEQQVEEQEVEKVEEQEVEKVEEQEVEKREVD